MVQKYFRLKLISLVVFLLSILNLTVQTNCKNHDLVCPEKTFEIADDVNNINICVKIGEKFGIKVEGNPTTGYGWYLQNRRHLDSSIQPLNLGGNGSGEYESDAHPVEWVGGGGSYCFNFLAKSNTENALIVLEYKRPWERDVPPIYTKKISVKIA